MLRAEQSLGALRQIAVEKASQAAERAVAVAEKAREKGEATSVAVGAGGLRGPDTRVVADRRRPVKHRVINSLFGVWGSLWSIGGLAARTFEPATAAKPALDDASAAVAAAPVKGLGSFGSSLKAAPPALGPVDPVTSCTSSSDDDVELAGQSRVLFPDRAAELQLVPTTCARDCGPPRQPVCVPPIDLAVVRMSSTSSTSGFFDNAPAGAHGTNATTDKPAAGPANGRAAGKAAAAAAVPMIATRPDGETFEYGLRTWHATRALWRAKPQGWKRPKRSDEINVDAVCSMLDDSYPILQQRSAPTTPDTDRASTSRRSPSSRSPRKGSSESRSSRSNNSKNARVPLGDMVSVLMELWEADGLFD